LVSDSFSPVLKDPLMRFEKTPVWLSSRLIQFFEHPEHVQHLVTKMRSERVWKIISKKTAGLYIIPNDTKYSLYIDENLRDNIIWWLYITNPHYVLDKIIQLKNFYHYHDEIKYSTISQYNILFLKALIDYFVEIEYTYFCMSFWKIKNFSYIDFVNKISKDRWWLYVFLDYITNYKWLYIEDELYKNKNIHYAIREDSKSNILIQVTDLLLACYTRDINKVESMAKKEVLSYFHQSGCGTKMIALQNTYKKR
jgi:hypothetical protein